MVQYHLFESIGKGASGLVYKGLNNETGEIVALKRINLLDKSKGIPSPIIREIAFLKEMTHSNIVRLLDVVNIDKEEFFVVLEYMNSDLKKFMDKNPEIFNNRVMIKRFLHQILSGLTYCHSHKILHRDLKPQNLLVDSTNNIVKIADFGSSREFDIRLKQYTPGEELTTLWYKAPEHILGDRSYSTAVDVWSVGCIFAEMVNKKPLFRESNDLLQGEKIFSILGTPNEVTWPGVTKTCDSISCFGEHNPKNLEEFVPGLEPNGVDLLSRMLCLNPSQRITASDALEHVYFGDLETP